MTKIQTAGTLLVAFVVFLTGAGFWLVREFEQPLAVRLRAVAAHLLRGGPFGPPIIAHSFGLLVGIVILLRE